MEKIKGKRTTPRSIATTLSGGIRIFRDELQCETLKYLTRTPSNRIKKKDNEPLKRLDSKNLIKNITYPNDVIDENLPEGVKKQQDNNV